MTFSVVIKLVVFGKLFVLHRRFSSLYVSGPDSGVLSRQFGSLPDRFIGVLSMYRDKLEIKIKKKLLLGFRFPRKPEFHVFVLQRTTKKCTKNYNASTQLLFCSFNLL